MTGTGTLTERGRTPPESAQPGADEMAALAVDDALRHLDTSARGLTEAEAQRRQARYGPNAIRERRRHPLLGLLRYFWGPIPWMIEAAAVLSGSLRDWADFSIIAALLVVNAGIGFWQESKAANALETLKKRLALRVRLLRDGEWAVRAAAEVVPGDVVRVRLGDIVPADLKILGGDELEVDQSALTGESLPAPKGQGGVLYSGSIIRRGETDALVFATGASTYFGRMVRLVAEARTVSHYQRAVLRIGRFLITVTLAMVLLILVVAILRDAPFLKTLQFCLILTVAAIPAALPAVFSVTMAIGAVRLARRQAVVSRLVSLEELAGMDVLCSDKTGTLTQNRLVLGEPVTSGAAGAEDVVRLAALASRAEDQDPIEQPIFEKLPGGPDSLKGYELLRYQPFDPVNKRTEALVRQQDGSTFRVSKGAPQVILDLCEPEAALRKRVESAMNDLAGAGYRALGVARTGPDDRWTFIGVLPLFDPPREDSAATIRAAEDLGVTVKMLTGDHLAIAEQIAHRLGMGENILPAAAVIRNGGEVDADALNRADGLAQVFPEHKYAIVSALQRLGHFVGMTGDGVNDAPALKKADVGIAVSGSTDAARSAADLVLTAPGLSVIVDAVRESRQIFRRMTSYAIYRVAETVRVLLFMTLSILVFDFYPVTAAMIVILALLNDGPIMMIAYDNTDIARRPVRWRMPRVLTIAATLGVLGVVSSFGMFWIGEVLLRLDRETIRTLMFLKLTVAGHMTIYLARTGEKPFWHRPLPSPALFFTSELTQVAATLCAVYGLFMNPIGWKLAGMIWGYAIAWFLVNDTVKIGVYRLVAWWRAWGEEHLGADAPIGVSRDRRSGGIPASSRPNRAGP